MDAPLWHIEFTGQRLCVAESAEGTFLVLFTSPARAYDFAQREALGDANAVSPTLYSVTRTEFMSRAEISAAGGACGVVIDPQADRQVGRIIEFRIGSPSEEPN